ncbi:MAG: hypothetical protein JNM71_05295 [Flavobacterium lindanitolerans]|jgi:hypothetical protein|nr:hypothetical protein [Flavobacterium lindanitolerans]MBL7867413.1 hypothetical protein [Flavobacterium lindanitolerans]OJX55473.1 MAG: hypothetical protein BGO88_04450 [Flavobacterium sp. 38-13]PZQ86538.1 MAG: hypothetical protein DI548_06945 [Flavobacterium johnsoniae]
MTMLFKSNRKQKHCQEWFDFKTLIALKIIFLLWGLSILGIYLRMFEITRGFKIAIPIAFGFFILSLFSRNKHRKEKGIVLFLFALVLFAIIQAIDIFAGTRYFSKL